MTANAANAASAAQSHYRQQVDLRRRKALDLLLASAFAFTLVLLVLVVWVTLRSEEAGRDVQHLASVVPWMLGVIVLSYVLSRWVSTDAASLLLLVTSVVLISFSAQPSELASGPTLIAYALPILGAGMLLPAWCAFLLAGLSSAAILLASIQSPGVLLTVPAVMVFFLLALVTWYFASSLEQSNRALNQVNATLTEDIAERKRTEAELRLMSYIVEQSPVAIVVMSQDGRFEYVNPRFTDMTGYTMEDQAHLNWQSLRPPDAAPDIDEQIHAGLAASSEWRSQTKRSRKDGTWFWEAVSISVLHDVSTGLHHYLAIAEDVTVRKEAEDALRNINSELEKRVNERTAELQRANVELMHSARLKDEFLATMSHELRTPLTGVLGAADVLGEQVHGPLNVRQQDSVRMVRESGKHLLALINGILDLSKIEAGDMALNMDTVGADEVCTAALGVVRNEAANKNLAISYSSTPAMLSLVADPVRLKQTLVNLLSNAVKFTPSGGSIGLEVLGDAFDEKVQFIVWDTGIGIAPEQQALVFEPFVQIDGGLSRQYSGVGLGLALVRKFAEMHGGGVGVESSLGHGSRFTVTLPWRPAMSPAAVMKMASERPSNYQRLMQEAITNLGHKPLVLLAEDSRTGIDIVLNYLEPLGCEMLVMLRGDEAVRAAVERKPDLILMDIQLPHLDGITAITQIRSHSDPQVAKIPILALTALAMSGDRERCLAAGANDYLSKPFSMAALVEASARLLTQ